jgi:hypothetical protein
VTNAACRVYNGIQHIPFPAVADPDGGDWLRRISPRHDRDHKFSAGYPPFEEEGAVSWMGIFDAFCRKRIAISINLVRLRVTGSRSLVRAHHKGAPGSLDAVCALGPWDPPRHRQRHDVVGRRTRRRHCPWFEGHANAMEPSSDTSVVRPSTYIMPQASLSPPPAQRRWGGFLFRAGRRCRLVMMTDMRPSWRR